MESRMEKYYRENPEYYKRSKRNADLYKDIDNNIVFVSRKKPNELFLTNIEIVLHYLNFLVPENFYPRLGEIYTVKLRHGEGTNPVLILGIDVYSMRVRLLFPDQGVARGQFMVFYTKDEKCLGSGMIVE